MLRDECVDAFNIASYRELIPADYHRGVMAGTINAAAVYDETDGDRTLFGLYLTQIRSEWMQLLYIHLEDPALELVEKGRFIRHCIFSDRERRSETIRGAFAEIYEDEAWPDAEAAYQLAGMETGRAQDNILEFTLDQAIRCAALKKAADRRDCIALADADPMLKTLFAEVIQNDKRPVPLPPEIDWAHYQQEVSFLCLREGVPCGALFFAQREEYLVAELGYSNDPVALAAMIWHAYTTGMDRFGGACRVLVPLVRDLYVRMVRELVPAAERGNILNAVMKFKEEE